MLLNLGHRWTLSRVVNTDGVVYLASGSTSERLRRNADSDFDTVLFDPQMYLASLDASNFSPEVGRLSTHEHFLVPGIDEFDSSASTRREWEQEIQQHAVSHWPGSAPTENIADSVNAAMSFQQDLGCTHILCPTPLVTSREDEAETLGLWLDESLVAADTIDVANPLLATVALSESVLHESVFESGGFLDTVVDQVASRDGIDGVYVVVGQTTPRHPLMTPALVQKCYAHLSRRFSDAGHEFVIINFADVFGLACMGAGATQIATGPSQSLRRLCLAPSRGRGALPNFYSHRCVAEFRTETDLDRVCAARAIRQVRDVTRFSRPLMQRLAAGGSASSIAAWAESTNNVPQAQKHFLERIHLESSDLDSLDTERRWENTEAWLDDASAAMDAVVSRVGSPPLRGRRAPVDEWLLILREYGSVSDG